MSDIQIIVLAAGHGRRMNNEIPKVLIPLRGKPIVSHLLAAITASGICSRPVIVVGQKADQIKAVLGSNYQYVTQDQQLGTGHAVNVTRSILVGMASDIMVLNGDHPFITPTMIQRLAAAHQQSGAAVTMGTVVVNDFNDWRSTFADFGRVIRNQQGNVVAVIEKKDATFEQLAIKEVNPSYFCFKAAWLWQYIEQLKNTNVEHEYYLTDLVGIACTEGAKIAAVVIQPHEALGINTAEQLAMVDRLFENRTK